jgi:hypothetical protein
MLAIVVSPIVSGLKRMRELGIALLLTLAVAEGFYVVYFVSVWCFFAALVSLVVVYMMHWLPKKV